MRGGYQGVQGATGLTGLTGWQGATGHQGWQGRTGHQGSTGMTGVTGWQGLTGHQGHQGEQGYQGVQGATGMTGLTGHQGVQGHQGHQGYDGHQGLTGYQGVQGFRGDRGNLGLTGAQGFTGMTGLTGHQGHRGHQGYRGVQGFTGLTGLTGWQGATGHQGYRGVQGSTGLTGMTGWQGATGHQGYQGVQGSTGVTGHQGWQGHTGLTGVTGWQGLTGHQGYQGLTGVQGMIGAYGANTFRWNFSGAASVNITGNATLLGIGSTPSTIMANKSNNDGVDMDNWFDNLKNHIDTNHGDAIISIISLNNPSKFFTGTIVHNITTSPITEVTPTTGSSYWEIDFTQDVSGGVPFTTQDTVGISYSFGGPQGPTGLLYDASYNEIWAAITGATAFSFDLSQNVNDISNNYVQLNPPPSLTEQVIDSDLVVTDISGRDASFNTLKLDGNAFIDGNLEIVQDISGRDASFNNIEAIDAYFSGKLTVDGLIDPTGLVLTKQTSAPHPVTSNRGNDMGY